jgi:hypothetical protein
MMQPMDNVHVDLCNNARCAESRFRDEFVKGYVRRVRREVRLVIVEECGVPVRLMTMGRMSTTVHGQCWRMALARGCIWRESVGLRGRGCGLCSTSIPLFESFLIESSGGDRLCDRRI